MRLLKLEMKRVLKTRLTMILLVLALFLSFVMAYLPVTFSYSSYMDESGNIVELTGLASMKHIKDLQSEITGTVTQEKVRKAVEDYQDCLAKYGVENSYDLPDGVYDTEILPYAPLLRGVREAFADPNTGMAPSLLEIDPEQIDGYYEACNERIASLMKMEQREYPAAQKAAIDMYSKVETPYLFFTGYTTDAMDYQILLAFLIMLICTVIAAPVFTSDYQTGADDILRCTKYGKTQFAATKILSAFLICGIAFFLCTVIYIIVSNCLFGWESTKTSIQMLYSIVNLPNMNINQLQCFTAVSCLLSILATVSFTLFISSKCKNVVASLSTALVFCMLPFVIYMALPSEIAAWIYGVLPSSGAALQTSILYAAVDFTFLNIGNIALWLPHVMLGAYLIEIPLFVFLAIYSYSQHKAN